MDRNIRRQQFSLRNHLAKVLRTALGAVVNFIMKHKSTGQQRYCVNSASELVIYCIHKKSFGCSEKTIFHKPFQGTFCCLPFDI